MGTMGTAWLPLVTTRSNVRGIVLGMEPVGLTRVKLITMRDDER
jgi:hypothetical protein